MIIVFGSLSGDHVVRVALLPKPGETRLSQAYAHLPGGKGANQAVAAAKAAADIVMCGCVGDDAAGELSRRALSAANVCCDALRTVDTHTGVALVWVEASAENMIVVAAGANAHTHADQVSDALLSQARYVLVQMEVPPKETWRFLDKAHKNGCTTVCNLAPEQPIPDAAWASLDMLIVNAHEARALLGASPTPDALQRLARARNTTVVMTQGADGALAVLPNAIWKVAALDIEPVDTTGAGDAFVGSLVARLDVGETLPEALRYASVASGLACMATGAQAALPAHKDVQAALTRVPLPMQLS